MLIKCKIQVLDKLKKCYRCKISNDKGFIYGLVTSDTELEEKHEYKGKIRIWQDNDFNYRFKFYFKDKK